MIDSSKFRCIRYKKPNFTRKRTSIINTYGLDTESDDNGCPFLCCLNDGTILDIKDFPHCLFDSTLNLINAHIGVYNIKYDSGSLLYFLPKETLIELWKMQKVKYAGYTIEYIPHKYMSISKGIIDKIRIWDIWQFYRMSLDKAASKYLGKSKDDMETKIFTAKYIIDNWEKIYHYCVKDALLVKELMDFLINKLLEFGIRTTALYSAASLSLRYYSDRGKICTSWRFWRYHRDLLKMAVDAYQGGKFEVTQRGYFEKVYEYDISSAYPSEIMNLYDIEGAKIEKDKRYRSDATYGFVHCIIDNSKGLYLPCGLKRDNLRVYPAGTFEMYCTKNEYDYMTKELNLDITIIEAYWLFVDFKLKLYEKRTKKLFELKSFYKNKDAMLYEVSKRMANSFYGKTVQLIKKPLTEEQENEIKELYEAGTGWNPIYGAIITANTRLKVTRLQNIYNDDCIAVHTDSVVLKKELDSIYITNTIGGFLKELEGPCIMIACGQYEIGNKGAYKGFVPERYEEGENFRYESWKEILQRNKNGYIIKYPIEKSESWIEAVAKGHFDKLNKFYKDTKEINLNADIKRIWLTKMKAKDFLCKNQKSLPVIVVDP